MAGEMGCRSPLELRDVQTSLFRGRIRVGRKREQWTGCQPENDNSIVALAALGRRVTYVN